MAGIVFAETIKNVASFFGSWVDFSKKLDAYGRDQGTDNRDAMVTSASGLLAAVTALAGTPGYTAISQLAGFATGSANLKNDVIAYNSATNENDKIVAAAAIASDSAWLVSGTATVVAAVATAAGAAALAASADAIIADAALLSAVSAVVSVGTDIGTWFNNVYLPGLNNFLNQNNNKQVEGIQINQNESNGLVDIIMAGQLGDDLLGSQGTYTEVGTSAGIVKVSSSGNLYVKGGDSLIDSSNSNVEFDGVSNAKVSGSGNNFTFMSGTENSVTLSGGGNSISLSGAAAGNEIILRNDEASANTLNLDGAVGAKIVIEQNAGGVNLTGSGGDVTISASGNGIITGISGENIKIRGDGLIFSASSGDYSLAGSGNEIRVSLTASVTISPFSDDSLINESTSEKFTTQTLPVGVLYTPTSVLLNERGVVVANLGVLSGDSTKFSINADGSINVHASMYGGAAELDTQIDANGNEIGERYFVGGALSWSSTYEYSGNTPIQENMYSATGGGSQIFKLDSKGGVVSGTGFDDQGQINAKLVNTGSSYENYQISNGSVGAINIFSSNGGVLNLDGYNGKGQQVSSQSIDRTTSASNSWNFVPGEAYARENVISRPISPGAVPAVIQDAFFDQNSGVVSSVTNYLGFNAQGVAATKQILSGSAGVYFSKIDTYDNSTGQIIDSATYNVDTGVLLSDSGNAAPAAVATSTFVSRSSSVHEIPPDILGAVSTVNLTSGTESSISSSVIPKLIESMASFGGVSAVSDSFHFDMMPSMSAMLAVGYR